MSDSAPPPRRTHSGPRSRGPLVLVVDDDEVTRDVYAAELAGAGFMVLEADSGAAGIEKALQFGPHAIVLDLMMPGIDGFKVARRLRTDDRTRDIPIVALTALASGKSQELAIAAGCDTFFTKPVLPALLIGELVRLIAKRTRESSTPDLSRLYRGH
jgi:two-component system cell cycle response regulator DivK